MTISMGFAMSHIDPKIEARSLVRQADHTLYRAKELGRNRVAIFSQSDP